MRRPRIPAPGADAAPIRQRHSASTPRRPHPRADVGRQVARSPVVALSMSTNQQGIGEGLRQDSFQKLKLGNGLAPKCVAGIEGCPIDDIDPTKGATCDATTRSRILIQQQDIRAADGEAIGDGRTEYSVSDDGNLWLVQSHGEEPGCFTASVVSISFIDPIFAAMQHEIAHHLGRIPNV